MESLSYFNKNLLDSKSTFLIKKLYEGNLSKADVDFLTQGLNLDTGDFQYMTFLARLGSVEGWQYFPENMVPRLKGFLRYFQAQNLFEKCEFYSLLKAIVNNDIQVMLLKSAAIKTYYFPNQQRIIYRYEIAVKPENFKKSLKIISNFNLKLLRKEKNFSEYSLNSDKRIKFIVKADIAETVWKNALDFKSNDISLKIINKIDFILDSIDINNFLFTEIENLWFTRTWIMDFLSLYDSSISFNQLYQEASIQKKEKCLDFLLEELNLCVPGFVMQNVQPKEYYEWKNSLFEVKELISKIKRKKTHLLIKNVKLTNIKYKLYKKTLGNNCRNFFDYLSDVYNTKNILKLIVLKLYMEKTT